MITSKTARPPDTRITATTPAIEAAITELFAVRARLDEHNAVLPSSLTAALDALDLAVRVSRPPLVTVRVLDRSQPVITVQTVTIPWICPACGGPRGDDVVPRRSYVHGIEMVWDLWSNPCGHIDQPQRVLHEAHRYAELVRGGA